LAVKALTRLIADLREGRGALGREKPPKSRGVVRHGADARAALAAVLGVAVDGILVKDSRD
jgi:hypothetical protein